MKKLLFYCQHILGIGHLIRSMEIARALTDEFEVCFVNGGQVIQGFKPPQSVQVINLPAIKTDSEFRELQVVDSPLSLEEAKSSRQQQLLSVFESFAPDMLMVELFPFGRRRFSFELVPLLESAKENNVKVVCSLRDIVVTKQDRARHEGKIVRLMNQYFDQLLIHGDPKLHPLEESFSRVQDLTCDVHYTGYVVQHPDNTRLTISDKISLRKKEPMIVVSVGGGRFGHELLTGVVKAAEIIGKQLPHRIQIFTGPFMPEEAFWDLKHAAQDSQNLNIDRYTPSLLAYMEKADLSISMAGYNTTMNILTTGVRALMLPFTGNDDQEQTRRVNRLAELGRVRQLSCEELKPEPLADAIVEQLNCTPTELTLHLNGAVETCRYLSQYLNSLHLEEKADSEKTDSRLRTMSVA